MTPQRVLIALIIAFGISAMMATATTIRQVHIAASPISQPIRPI
jgi:hypothetical protein